MKLSLDNIISTLCPKASEPLVGRLLYALYHYYKIPPLHLVALRVLVILRQFEASCLQTFHIHHHTTILSMKQFHQFTTGSDEDKHVAIAYITPHLLMHHTAE